jgi:hypothetical protein
LDTPHSSIAYSDAEVPEDGVIEEFQKTLPRSGRSLHAGAGRTDRAYINKINKSNVRRKNKTGDWGLGTGEWRELIDFPFIFYYHNYVRVLPPKPINPHTSDQRQLQRATPRLGTTNTYRYIDILLTTLYSAAPNGAFSCKAGGGAWNRRAMCDCGVAGQAWVPLVDIFMDLTAVST